MKMSLRFTAGALLVLTVQAVCRAALHANESGLQHARSGPGYRPSVGQSVGFVAEFQQPVVDF
jgi:hypothetical protein